jgi:hypothetical protein
MSSSSSCKPNYKLFLTFSSKSVKKIKKIFHENDSIPWLYLGHDLKKRNHMEQKLGTQFTRINIAKLHDEVANDIRLEHVHWIDNLNRCYGKNIEWWFESVSSRNIYSSNLFQYCCYLEILARLCEIQEKRPRLVVIESFGLFTAIKKWAVRNNITIKIIHYSQLNQGKLISYLISFLRWGKFAAIMFFRWMAAYSTKHDCKLNKLKIEPSIILDTYLHDNCLSKSGVFKDRYFPYLHEYLYKKGMHVLVHPIFYGFRFNYFSIYKRMRKSSTLFIIPEDFLNFLDYISVLTYPIRVLHQKIKAPSFRNHDISDILMEELRVQSLTSGLLAVLIYRLFLRLGKAGLRPKQIISWYENQVINKALIAGARIAFPRAKIIGAQMFIHCPNWLNLYPSQSEVEFKVTPHILLETSQYQCQVAKPFTKSIPCMPAAALRYAHVFLDENTYNYDNEKKSKSVLVLLPFNIAEAVELLEVLKEAMNQIKDNRRILIKTHPDYNSKELINAFGRGNWPHQYEIFQGHLPEALKQASLVISSNSSSIVEAAVKGIPVIFLGRQTVLNQNILANLNMDIVTECFSSSELVTAINKYLALLSIDLNEYRKMGEKIRDLYFTPINEETMLPFLNIHNEK